MSRKDNKNRILRNGENQRKDGRYVYQYTDINGKRHSVYSWTLNPTDRVPAGKKPGKSLRELEEEIKNSEFNFCDLLVCNVVMSFCEDNTKNLKDTTRHNYNTLYNAMRVQPFWKMKITDLNKLQCKKYLNDMLDSYGSSTVWRCKTVLKNAFDIAVESDYLKKNPFDFKFTIENCKSKQRNAIPQNQLDLLLAFCLNSNIYRKWFYVITILVNTGMRISEFLGLTFNDIDLENDMINVNHQLMRCYGQGHFNNLKKMIRVETLKSQCSYRSIPMSPEVKESFQWIIDNRKTVEIEYEVDGYSGFVFLNRWGKPFFASSVDRSFRAMIDAYNKKNEEKIVKFSPHYLRHTFCTNMLEKGMNPKSVQYLMGHAKIGITFNTYAHTNANVAISDMRNLWKSSEM